MTCEPRQSSTTVCDRKPQMAIQLNRLLSQAAARHRQIHISSVPGAACDQRVPRQVVALPPVEMVSKGLIDPHAIAACTEKVDIWALGITLYELLTGACHCQTPHHTAAQHL